MKILVVAHESEFAGGANRALFAILKYWSTNKLVEYNVYSDLSLILNQNNSLIISDKEISKQKLNEDEYNKKSAILMAQHLENIYKICNNRILQDFDKSYTYDEDYQDYLTMLSKYILSISTRVLTV